MLCFSCSSDSYQFQKQLMTKPKTYLGFKPLGNHHYIKRISGSNKLQKEKRVVSPSVA